jgi:hypothetical protein
MCGLEFPRPTPGNYVGWYRAHAANGYRGHAAAVIHKTITFVKSSAKVLCTGQYVIDLPERETSTSYFSDEVTCRRCKELLVELALATPEMRGFKIDELLIDEVGKPNTPEEQAAIREKVELWLRGT